MYVLGVMVVFDVVHHLSTQVWGIYSAITNSTTGENRLGFLRAWAEDALHPVDVVTQWWT